MSSHRVTAFEHQQWQEVKIRPKSEAIQKRNTNSITQNLKPSDVIRRHNGGKNKQNNAINSNNIERKLDEWEYELPHVSQSLKMQIQKARLQKGLTQEQLAGICNLPVSLIRNYENGTAITNSGELLKLSKALGVNLKK